MIRKNIEISNSHLLLLEGLSGFGPVAIEAVLTYLQRGIDFPGTDAGVLNLLKAVKKTYGRLKLPALEVVVNARKKSDQIILKSEKEGIQIISFLDDAYPAMLRSIPGRPLLLHYKGNLSALDHPTVAIVGTRKDVSSFTDERGKELTRSFVNAGFTIVSGLAEGCDTIAHQVAVDNNRPTVAIMAGGLNNIYPSENKLLAKDILEQDGLLISEWPCSSNPTKSSFKLRNRIQVGLSRGVVVLQTNTSGGTMHTVNYAQEQRKPVGCLYPRPSELDTILPADGNQALIKEKRAIKLNGQDSLEHFIEKLRGNHKLNL